MNCRIRPATLEDCELLFNWVNDPEVRKASFNPNKIEWFDHEKWFERKIHTPDSHILIFEVDKIPVGQIRFDKDNNKCYEIDFSIQKEFRGLSYGTMIIKNGLEYMARIPLEPVVYIGNVRKNNLGSSKAFISNNFRLVSENSEFLTFKKNI